MLAAEGGSLSGRKINSTGSTWQRNIHVGADNLTPYIYKLARNTAIQYKRKQPRVDLEIPAMLDIQLSPIEENRRDALEQALQILQPAERELIFSYYDQESRQKRKDLAEKLGVSEGKLRLRAYRLREKIRKEINKILESHMTL